MQEPSTALIALNTSLIDQNFLLVLNNFRIQCRSKITINTKESIIPELENFKPGFLFVSSDLPGVVTLQEIIVKVKQISPRTKVVVVTNETDTPNLLTYLLSNTDAIIFEKHLPESLPYALTQLAKEQSFVCGRTVNDLKLQLLQQKLENRSDLGLLEHLTEREIEVLYSLTQGGNYKQISKILFISESTVKTHVNNIFNKLNVNDRTLAVLYALRHGIENVVRNPHLVDNLLKETSQK